MYKTSIKARISNLEITQLLIISQLKFNDLFDSIIAIPIFKYLDTFVDFFQTNFLMII